MTIHIQWAWKCAFFFSVTALWSSSTSMCCWENSNQIRLNGGSPGSANCQVATSISQCDNCWRTRRKSVQLLTQILPMFADWDPIPGQWRKPVRESLPKSRHVLPESRRGPPGVSEQLGIFWCTHYLLHHGRLGTCPFAKIGMLILQGDSGWQCRQAVSVKSQWRSCPRREGFHWEMQSGRTCESKRSSFWDLCEVLDDLHCHSRDARSLEGVPENGKSSGGFLRCCYGSDLRGRWTGGCSSQPIDLW